MASLGKLSDEDLATGWVAIWIFKGGLKGPLFFSFQRLASGMGALPGSITALGPRLFSALPVPLAELLPRNSSGSQPFFVAALALSFGLPVAFRAARTQRRERGGRQDDITLGTLFVSLRNFLGNPKGFLQMNGLTEGLSVFTQHPGKTRVEPKRGNAFIAEKDLAEDLFQHRFLFPLVS